MQLRQQAFVQPGPDAGLGPVPQPAPQVTPEQPTSEAGTWFPAMPVLSWTDTYRS